ncbi:MAG: helix-turn-helix transcriptional regulator [Clostridia bacterium]|nr:helix-turn-helix transcriptional regulator [Clostridia bacterium]
MLPNLKLLRKKKGISQQSLAEYLGLTQQSINQYENQNTEPDIDTLIKIADYFDTSLDFLVGREYYKNEVIVEDHSYTPDDVRILDKYHALCSYEKECVTIVIDTLLKK